MATDTNLAPCLKLLNRCLPQWNSTSGRVYIFICTFLLYSCFHASRKPISVVKSILHQNCSEAASKSGRSIVPENMTYCDWKPFDGDNYNYLFGTLDLAYLSAYAVFMFISGHAADRFHLRNFLSIGSMLCGITTISFGLGYFFDVHSYTFYLLIQLFGGAAQATGWPAVVSSMGNWFGKSQRGFFMGVWNAHTSVGNILGSLIAGVFVERAWGWSFIVPGLLILCAGILTYLFLAPYPEELNLASPNTNETKDFEYTNQFESSVDQLDELEITGSTSLTELTPIMAEAPRAVSFLTALRVPGVIEYSFSLFFCKMVSYTFLFWLPDYIREAGGFDPTVAADLSAVFDLGGIAGGILTGVLADRSGASATVCVLMLIGAVPALFLFFFYGILSTAHCIGLLIPLGLLVNGPYTLITTAVSTDLGTHSSLKSNSRALATVTGIIDGTGSVGAALGPLLCGVLKPHGWMAVFAMLTIALILAAVLLIRRVIKEVKLSYRFRYHATPTVPVA